jgi:Zn-dependent peptidase ImmA (M78 family)
MKNSDPNQLSLFELLKLRDPRLSDREAVRVICEQLLVESGVVAPVNVGLLASMRGIVRIEEHPQVHAGMLVHQPGGMVAHIRSGDSPARRRFTILHEAGHTLLPGYVETMHYRCAGPRTLEEQLCDVAASELLLPRQSFRRDLAATGFGNEAAGFLAERYEASMEATAVRSVDLWPDAALLLVLKRAHKPADAGQESEVEPKLRLTWGYGKGSWPYSRKHKSAADDSPFARAHAGELIDEVGILGDLVAGEVGPVRISARRYGADGRVLAMITKPSPAWPRPAIRR